MKDETVHLPLRAAGPATERPISITILAMGGQGGGVLTDWIVRLAEDQGWAAQSTSVPGVAQRTGATLYYIECMPPQDGLKPILSLMPTPGDVDVVMAAEFMEAGRSILRGLVTPDKTILIASDHRAFATVEKIAPGEAIADSSVVAQAIGVVAKREIVFDMNALAAQHGSMISAAMFGALAASGALPFDVALFRALLAGESKGRNSSLAAFEAAYERTVNPPAPDVTAAPAPRGPFLAARFADRVARDIPEPAREMARLGLAKAVDFQDAAYGEEYLDLLGRLRDADEAAGGAAHGYAFTVAAAKYLANAMAYDDVIRVADLKTRASRRARVEREIGLKAGQVLQTTEYFHPRAEELIGMAPKGWADWINARPGLRDWLDRRVNKGRRIRTYSAFGFATLYVLAGLKSHRRASHRHAVEVAHRDAWIARAIETVARNYDLGVEVLNCRRLIKGYSDTHARGLSKYDRVMVAIGALETRADAADWARRLREAAIRDASGATLDGAIKTIGTFA
ncbi:MAG TPA: indolepyruvate oxidoreductase subunit beta family protein [Rhodoblastus sp.]|nr:indolepyruvate oxidoreductase subunit beta family protein [Rhodoblastus sp.]